MTKPQEESVNLKSKVASYVLEMNADMRASASRAHDHEEIAQFTRRVVNASLVIGGIAGVVSMFLPSEYKEAAQVASTIAHAGGTIGLSGQMLRMMRGDEGLALEHWRHHYVCVKLLKEIEPTWYHPRKIRIQSAKLTMGEYDDAKKRAPFMTSMEREEATARVLWEENRSPAFMPGLKVPNKGTYLDSWFFPGWNLPKIKMANAEGKKAFIKQCEELIELW